MSFSAAERDKELFRNIVQAFEHIERYTAGMSQPDFLIDARTQDAVAMRLQQVLECSLKLSPDTKSRQNIDWSSLVAMRNKISHSYVDVNAEIVWEVIRDFDEFHGLVAWAKCNI